MDIVFPPFYDIVETFKAGKQNDSTQWLLYLRVYLIVFKLSGLVDRFTYDLCDLQKIVLSSS